MLKRLKCGQLRRLHKKLQTQSKLKECSTTWTSMAMKMLQMNLLSKKKPSQWYRKRNQSKPQLKKRHPKKKKVKFKLMVKATKDAETTVEDVETMMEHVENPGEEVMVKGAAVAVTRETMTEKDAAAAVDVVVRTVTIASPNKPSMTMASRWYLILSRTEAAIAEEEATEATDPVAIEVAEEATEVTEVTDAVDAAVTAKTAEATVEATAEATVEATVEATLDLAGVVINHKLQNNHSESALVSRSEARFANAVNSFSY